ncbi:eukaryotic translation initiation factor 5A-1-like [Tubulanus polymorphus]|uniref:eukaryotic translation initiation factor 5A-1-like n=1 Tax=Tubulanus polymorphus TaxID=672921 RepID=UPI003DA32E5A
MSHEHDYDTDFETGAAGAAKTYPQKASHLKKGGYTMINERPCKVANISTSKTGKHGCAKVHVTAIDIFTQKKLETIFSSTSDIDVPHVHRNDLSLIDIDEGFCYTMCESTGDIRENIKLPSGELGDKIKKLYDEHGSGNLMVTLQEACCEEIIVDIKPARRDF